jgi:hypothetical protein
MQSSVQLQRMQLPKVQLQLRLSPVKYAVIGAAAVVAVANCYSSVAVALAMV